MLRSWEQCIGVAHTVLVSWQVRVRVYLLGEEVMGYLDGHILCHLYLKTFFALDFYCNLTLEGNINISKGKTFQLFCFMYLKGIYWIWMMAKSMGYRCFVFNVKGINHYIKRKLIQTYLRQHKVDIALLQETHSTDTEHGKLKRGWYNQVYFSSFKSTPFHSLPCPKTTMADMW